mgnify:CR=1 FL=1
MKSRTWSCGRGSCAQFEESKNVVRLIRAGQGGYASSQRAPNILYRKGEELSREILAGRSPTGCRLLNASRPEKNYYEVEVSEEAWSLEERLQWLQNKYPHGYEVDYGKVVGWDPSTMKVKISFKDGSVKSFRAYPV